MNEAFVAGALASTDGAGRALSAKDDLSAGLGSGVSAIFKLMSDVLTSSRGFAADVAGDDAAASAFLGTSYLNDDDGTSYRSVDDVIAAGDVGVVSVLSFGVSCRTGSDVVRGATSGWTDFLSLGVVTSSVLAGAAAFFANGCFPSFKSTTSYGFVSGYVFSSSLSPGGADIGTGGGCCALAAGSPSVVGDTLIGFFGTSYLSCNRIRR